MKPIPPSETYERELRFMPYRESLEEVLGIICSQTPRNGKLIDWFCLRFKPNSL